MEPIANGEPKRAGKIRSLLLRSSKKAGLSPGSVVFVGERKLPSTTIRIIDYDATHHDEREVSSAEECFPYIDSPRTTWIMVEGLQNTDAIEKLGKYIGMQLLELEDVVNTFQRSRFEADEDQLFCVVKGLRHDRETGEISIDQTTLVVGKNYVISFQENQEQAFEAVKKRLNNPGGRHRNQGAVYLAYSLIDALVDHYFSPLENMAEKIEHLELQAVSDPRPEVLKAIHRTKRDLAFVRRSILPMREVVSAFQRSDSGLIAASVRPYLADVYDHTIQVLDIVESFRDIVGGLLETYLSSISNRMNEVMKLLTLIATVFIPLTFIAGVYGMNFDHMPELHWEWFYPHGFWITIAVVVLLMLAVFRRKGWI
ncbi:MAG: magnesium/cobalt transporter CorA [Bacteroidota bacterium]